MCWLVLVLLPSLPAITATFSSVTSLGSASFPRAPVSAARRPLFPFFPSAAAFAVMSALLLLPVLKENGVCQGVQRRPFVRLVRAWGLELAIALLRIALVDAFGVRRAYGVRLVRMVISARETVGKDFSFPAQCGGRGVLGLIVGDPRWEPGPQEKAWTLTPARRGWLHWVNCREGGCVGDVCVGFDGGCASCCETLTCGALRLGQSGEHNSGSIVGTGGERREHASGAGHAHHDPRASLRETVLVVWHT